MIRYRTGIRMFIININYNTSKLHHVTTTICSLQKLQSSWHLPSTHPQSTHEARLVGAPANRCPSSSGRFPLSLPHNLRAGAELSLGTNDSKWTFIMTCTIYNDVYEFHHLHNVHRKELFCGTVGRFLPTRFKLQWYKPRCWRCTDEVSTRHHPQNARITRWEFRIKPLLMK